MSQKLFEKLDTLLEEGIISKDIPVFVTSNLNPSFLIRPYQIEGFSRFFYYFDGYSKKTKPVHLLFNMATGSGKTYMMAGSILYLYQKGYRKFLFFVNSRNIIAKTRENFLGMGSNKYLFADKILFAGNQVNIREVENFSSDDGEDIEIKFTTIHGLHTDMNEVREGRLSYEEFEDKKIVMISDEAHHINSLTKSKLAKDEDEEKKSWEHTVMKILGMNTENLLLEYTATIDDTNSAIIEKYADKLIYKYDLKKFRADGWSKELDIIKSDLSQEDRVLQALILSQYRLKIAEKYRIRCKPVILFKAQKEKIESDEHEKNFHQLIENLQSEQFETLKSHTEIDIVKTALNFFESGIGFDGLIRELREDFKKENCLNMNEESLDKKSINKKAQSEVLSQASILNTLEDKNNPIRAIFAVQKLNEGWDVLNLFDIVRMYDTRDGEEKNGKYTPGKGTLSEAQLIGRGARYYPFAYESYMGEDKYKRKFDKQEHELKILETFYYHTFFNSRYISEIKQALKDMGMIDEDTKPFKLNLKESFKQTSVFLEGVVYTNEKKEKPTDENDTLEKIGIRTKTFEYRIATGKGGDDMVFDEETEKPEDIGRDLSRVSYKIPAIDIRIVLKAIARNNFYTFANLKTHLGKLTSIDEFIQSEKYLGSIEITFASSTENIQALKDRKLPDMMVAGVSKILRTLEGEIISREKEYEGTKEFKAKNISKVFEEKTIQVSLSENGITLNQEWFAFEKIVSTGEEEGLILCIEGMIEKLGKKYENIYLLRSERHFAIYDFDNGDRFEPDFVLYMQEKSSHKPLTYQIFIEPKGGHLLLLDKWKEDFLLQIEGKAQILDMNFGEYKLVGLPFYNQVQEQKFIGSVQEKFL